MAETKTLHIVAYPYVTVDGDLTVPKNLPEEEYREYISEHWDEIGFDMNDADVDFAGTDFDYSE